MRFRNLIYFLTFMLLGTAMVAQEDVMVIEGGAGAAGLLETTINGDTTDTGERANPNRIYELVAGEFYLQHAAINVDNPTGTITIRGQAGGSKAVILKQPLDEIAIGTNQLNSSLTFQNIQYHDQQTDGTIPWAAFNISGPDHKLIVEDVLVENCNGIIFNLSGVPQGAHIEIRNSYFRDFHNFAQWWAGRVVECKVPVDTLIFENNTVTGAGLLILGQQCLIDFALINHNTLINTRKYPFLNQYYREAYITNNLFVNANMVGEDLENVATGGQDPDALLHGIVGIDTIEADLAIQSRYLTADSTLTEDVDDFSDITFYVADNVVTSSASLDAYYAGNLDPDWDDAPSSYLTWGGVDGPFKVVNVPGIWINERSAALINDHESLKMENNSVYEMRTADLGLVTDPLPQEAADPFIQWNQVQWGLPGVEAPVKEAWLAYQFGDYDPVTIPGVETETAPAGSGGITKISDMIEDFSYTADLTSSSDGLRIGALHWNDEAFDAAASLDAIKNAYSASTSVKEIKTAQYFNLKSAPNPFVGSTIITFEIPENSAVDLSIYDISGKLVTRIAAGQKPAGAHSVVFNAHDLSAGTYVYRLTTNKHTATGKMILNK